MHWTGKRASSPRGDYEILSEGGGDTGRPRVWSLYYTNGKGERRALYSGDRRVTTLVEVKSRAYEHALAESRLSVLQD